MRLCGIRQSFPSIIFANYKIYTLKFSGLQENTSELSELEKRADSRHIFMIEK